MTLSQVIASLTELLAKHGDIPVYAAEIEGGAYGELQPDGICFDVECGPFYIKQHEKVPNRITIAIN